jgi:hypothetical protein
MGHTVPMTPSHGRSPLPAGEVELELAWVERGVPHACQQIHVLQLSDGGIARDTDVVGG